jgi:hypothetical protein
MHECDAEHADQVGRSSDNTPGHCRGWARTQYACTDVVVVDVRVRDYYFGIMGFAWYTDISSGWD